MYLIPIASEIRKKRIDAHLSQHGLYSAISYFKQESRVPAFKGTSKILCIQTPSFYIS